MILLQFVRVIRCGRGACNSDDFQLLKGGKHIACVKCRAVWDLLPELRNWTLSLKYRSYKTWAEQIAQE